MAPKKLMFTDNEAKEIDQEIVGATIGEDEVHEAIADKGEESTEENDDIVEETEETDYEVFDFKEEEQSSNTEPQSEKEKEPSSSSRKSKSIFSEQDVIVLLEEYASFRAVDDTQNDWVSFYNIVKPKLSNQCLSKTQVSEKIHSLRKKFVINCTRKKSKAGGDSPDFRGPHEARVFSLSESIWNAEVYTDDNGKRKSSPEQYHIHVKQEEHDETTKKPKLSPPCSVNNDAKSSFPLVFQSFAETGVGHLADKYCWMHREDAFEFEDQLKKLKVQKLRLEVEYRELLIKRLEGTERETPAKSDVTLA